IAAAVRVLVMIADDRKHQAQRLQWKANPLAGHRMLLHDLPFRRSQVASLLQDLIRDSDLSQIVQIAAPPEGDNTLFIHSEKAPEIRGIARQTFTVALGIRIARLDA